MMDIGSLGLRTDLMLIGWDGAIDEVDGALRARSPSKLGADTLVIVGLPDHTAHVYASVGFVECERLVAAFRSRANSAENGSAITSSTT